jgi:DNA-binding SARP family transcriptional activator
VANVRGYAGSLRRRLASAEPGRERLVRHGPGYVLHADEADLDLLAFTAHATAARSQLHRGKAELAAARLADALGCWCGATLAGLPRGPALAARCAALDEQRLAIVEELATIHLGLERPRDAATLLREHVARHPLRERGRLLLMCARYRLGDLPAALATYEEGRAAFVEWLGIEPGPELQAMHRRILAREPEKTEPIREPVRGGVP